MLGGMKLVKQRKYLGLSNVIGRSKRQVFNYIKEKVISRMGGWKEKFLCAEISNISSAYLCNELL